MGLQDRTKTRGVPSNRGVPFLLSRRAHLLTTPKGRWYCLRQPCALRGGCGSCGSLMSNATPLRSCCHRPRRRLEVLLYPQNNGMTIRHPIRRLPAKTCRRQLCRREGVAVHDTLFFLRKRNKNKDTLKQRIPYEGKVKTNGNLSFRGESGQQRYGTICCGSFRISELHQHPQ